MQCKNTSINLANSWSHPYCCPNIKYKSSDINLGHIRLYYNVSFFRGQKWANAGAYGLAAIATICNWPFFDQFKSLLHIIIICLKVLGMPSGSWSEEEEECSGNQAGPACLDQKFEDGQLLLCPLVSLTYLSGLTKSSDISFSSVSAAVDILPILNVNPLFGFMSQSSDESTKISS